MGKASRVVDRRGAVLVGDLLADHPDEVLCSNWQRSSFEDHGQVGGDLPSYFGIAHPSVPGRGREPDVQLVAVVPLRSVDPGVGVVSDRGFPADAVPWVGGCDPRVPDGRAEGAPCRVEQEVTAQRALPGEDGVRTAGVFGNQHVGVEQVSVDQVASLGAGFDQGADACFAGPVDAVDLDLPDDGCPPAVNLLARGRRRAAPRASRARSGRCGGVPSASQPAGPGFSAP